MPLAKATQPDALDDHPHGIGVAENSPLWLETMGLEITESILITETGVECLANVPRKLVVKD